MGNNTSDLTKCVVCGIDRAEAPFSKRYRNTCVCCSREKSRQATFKKTGRMPKPKIEWKNGVRECTSCHKIKTKEEFGWRRTPRGKQIKNSVCLDCHNSKQNKAGEDPEVRKKRRMTSQRYYQEGPGKRKEKNARYLREYGITIEDKEEMIRKNGGLCPICKTDNPGQWWAVDHCHKTGKIRGVICDKCNKMLGLANDDVMRLLSAARYLLDHYLSKDSAQPQEGVIIPDEDLEETE